MKEIGTMDKIFAVDATYPVTVDIKSGVTGYRITIPAGVVTVERTSRWEPEKPPAPEPPLVFLQCDGLWGNQIYAPGGTLTFCQAGCLVCCVASLAAWAGYDTDPPLAADALGRVGAFAGNNLSHHEKVTEAFPLLEWKGKEDWHKKPANLELLRELLEKQPVIVEVDYKPGTPAIDQHFVLAYEYVSDPTGGLNDDLKIMDSMAGYTTATSYFNPSWLSWCQENGVTKVQRTLTGARIFGIS